MKTLINYSSRFRILKGGKISLVISALLGSITLSFAAPSGGVVTSGSATISQSGAVTNINQSTNKASINWNTFSIASHETVNFNQPNASSITLNRVVGNERSVINGALNANGQVWILNSNGVLFGKNASINTAGLLTTTAQLSDEDFQVGNYNFKNSTANSIINQGTITVSDAGSVILASNEVINEGSITAVLGKVHLVGADSYSVNLNGNSLVSLRIDKGVLDAMVKNSGTVLADGGEIYLTTNAVDELLKGVVNNTGVLQAQSFDEAEGKIITFAHGGTIEVGGTLDTLKADGSKGGFIETSGRYFALLEDANIKAGEWLIDPVNLTIDAALALVIETSLGLGNVTLETATPSITNGTIPAGSQGVGDGDITIASAITWNSANSLTLQADNNIYVNAAITGNGDLNLYADAIDVNSNMTITGANILLDADRGSALAHSNHGILIDDAIAIKTLTSGNITMIGRSGNAAANLKGIMMASTNATTISAAGNLSMTGYSEGQSASGNRGIDLSNDILSAGGTITLRGQHGTDSSYAVSIYDTVSTAAITSQGLTIESLNNSTGTLNLNGTGGFNAGSGNIVLRGANVRLAPGLGDITTTGNLSILPDADETSFANTFSTSEYTGTISAGSLTIGGANNNSDITLAKSLSIGGAISVYGKDITINEDLTIQSTLANADILFKATNNILLNDTTTATISTIQSNGGDITFWSDSDGSSAGGIQLTGDYTDSTYHEYIAVKSKGGDITLAGGTTTDSNGKPTGYAYNSGSINQGIFTRQALFDASVAGSSVASTSGNVFMKGSTSSVTGDSSGDANIGLWTRNTRIYANEITLTGENTGATSSNGVADSGRGFDFNNNSQANAYGDMTFTGIQTANTTFHALRVGVNPSLSSSTGNITFAMDGKLFFASSDAISISTGKNVIFDMTSNSPSSTAFTNNITGAGGVIKKGAGQLTLGGTLSYTGNTSVEAGTLLASAGSTGSLLSVLSGATYQLTGNVAVGALEGAGSINLQSYGLTTGALNQNKTFSGVISGTGSLTKNGTGTLTLTNDNTYTGTTNISAGKLVIQNDTPTLGNKTINGSGALTIESSSASFTGAFSTTGWTFANTLTGLTLGKSGNTSDITVDTTQAIAGPISLYGGNIVLNQKFEATGSNALTLEASNSITDGTNGYVVADKLALKGSGSITLDNVLNDINTIAAGNDNSSAVGAITIVDKDDLIIGTVNPSGITSSGLINIATLTGDLTISNNISTTSTADNAITLNAGQSSSAGTATGGDIKHTSGTITTGTGGRAKLFSGSDASSTGLSALATANSYIKYSADEVAEPTYETTSGKYVIYRGAQTVAQPTRNTTTTTSTTEEQQGVNNIVSTINNNSATAIQVPSLTLNTLSSNSQGVTTYEPRMVLVLNENMSTSSDTGFNAGSKVIVLSKPLDDQGTVRMTLSDILKMQKENNAQGGNSDEVRVPLGQKYIVDLVNGGVRLPIGVEQVFYLIQLSDDGRI